MTNFPDIRRLLPHSGKMVLLDRIVHAENDSICTEVTLHKESLFLKDNKVGAWIGIEYMAQTIGAHAGYKAYLQNQPIKIGFLLGTRKYISSINYFKLGEILHITAHNEFTDNNGLASFRCNIHNQNKLLSTATLTVFQPENAEAFLKSENT